MKKSKTSFLHLTFTGYNRYNINKYRTMKHGPNKVLNRVPCFTVSNTLLISIIHEKTSEPFRIKYDIFSIAIPVHMEVEALDHVDEDVYCKPITQSNMFHHKTINSNRTIVVATCDIGQFVFDNRYKCRE